MTITRSSAAPLWQSRPPMLARFGRVAELALSKESGSPVTVEAFEVGQIIGKHRALKILGLVLLSPLWIPALLMLALVLAIPSMIYTPYRTWREWDEAKSVGVSSATMVFTVIMVIGFGFIGGIMLTLTLLGRLLPKTVVVARLVDRTALLHQRMPMFYFPQFTRIEYVDHSDVSKDPKSTAKKILLCLRRGQQADTIVVRRGIQRVTGDPQVNEANLALLLAPSRLDSSGPSNLALQPTAADSPVRTPSSEPGRG